MAKRQRERGVCDECGAWRPLTPAAWLDRDGSQLMFCRNCSRAVLPPAEIDHRRDEVRQDWDETEHRSRHHCIARIHVPSLQFWSVPGVTAYLVRERCPE